MAASPHRPGLLPGSVTSSTATIGPNEYQLLSAWLEAAGLRREGALVEFTLRVRTELQQQFLRTAFDSIAAFGHILRRWEQGGSN